MTDSCQEAGFRLVGRFGHPFGIRQCLIELRQLMCSLGHPLFKPFVGLGQCLFGFAERGNVSETHDKTAPRHGVADQFDNPAIGEQAFGGMRSALAHPVQATGHMHFGFPGAAQAAFSIVTNDVGNRASYADQSVRVVEELQIATIPGHQLERLINHANPLGDVFNRAL